jgi:NPH3 family
MDQISYLKKISLFFFYFAFEQDMYGRVKKKIDPKQEHEKRIIIETIVSLLPRERNSISVSFLSMLLRASIYLDTTIACRLDLEKRIALQLGQAVLDDLMIPSFSDDAIFDVDTVKRILTNYIEHEGDGSRLDYATDDDLISLPPSDAAQVHTYLSMHCFGLLYTNLDASDLSWMLLDHVMQNNKLQKKKRKNKL